MVANDFETINLPFQEDAFQLGAFQSMINADYQPELTVVILNGDETHLENGFLNPEYVEITENNTLYGLRGITISHLLVDDNNDDLSLYDEILIPGNKVWRKKTTDGDSCLYVILGNKEYDFTNNKVTVYAEEVATELGQYKILRNSAFSWTVNEYFFNTYLADLFTAGTLTGPSTATKYNGALTPLAMLQEIQTNTGGEFKFNYDLIDGVIVRTIDYLTQVGKEINTPIEIGYNTKDLILNVDETDARIAAGPIGKPEDAAKEFHKALKDFEALSVSTDTQIPLYVTTDDNGDPLNGPDAYPPYNKPAGQKYLECDNSSELVASYQRINRKDEDNTYEDDFEDGKWGRAYDASGTVRTAPYQDWLLRGGTAAIESGSPLSGTYSVKHTGDGTSSVVNRLYQSTTERPTRVTYTWELVTQGSISGAPTINLWFIRYEDPNNNVRLNIYYNSSTGKQTMNLIEKKDGVDTTLGTIDWLTGKLGTGTPYDLEIIDLGFYCAVYIDGEATPTFECYYTTSIGTNHIGFGSTRDSAALWDNISVEYDNTFPRIHAFESSETDPYNIYWACVDNIREHLNPVVELEASIVDLKKLMGETPDYFNCGDTVYLRLPGWDDLITARILETTKDPRHPEDDSIVIGNYVNDFLNDYLDRYYKNAGNIDLTRS